MLQRDKKTISDLPDTSEITSFDPGEGTSGVALQRSDSEYSDQEQGVPAFGQEEEMDDRVYWTVWV